MERIREEITSTRCDKKDFREQIKEDGIRNSISTSMLSVNALKLVKYRHNSPAAEKRTGNTRHTENLPHGPMTYTILWAQKVKKWQGNVSIKIWGSHSLRRSNFVDSGLPELSVLVEKIASQSAIVSWLFWIDHNAPPFFHMTFYKFQPITLLAVPVLTPEVPISQRLSLHLLS